MSSEDIPSTPAPDSAEVSDGRESRPHFQKIKSTLSVGREQATINPGELLDSYRLIRKIDNGSFGQVWEALDTRSDELAAIKIFDRINFPESALEAAERFCDGASAMGRLRGSPNVIELFEGPHFDPPRGLIWFSMRFYPERDLARWAERHTLTTAMRLRIIADLLLALRAAHTYNPPIVHRDVRPKNILIDIVEGEPRAILIDFDIAYYEDIYRQRLSTVRPLGELRYIPSDVGGGGNTIASKLRRPSNDLFALAVVTLDLFTPGGLPLDSSAKQIAHAIAQHNPRDPDPWLRKALATFLYRALRPSEQSRLRSIEEYERSWRVVIEPSRAAKFWIGVATVATLIFAPSLLVVADWLWSTFRDSLWIGIAAKAVALLSATSALAIVGGWLCSIVVAAIQQRALSLVLTRPKPIIGAMIGVALIALTGAASTHPLRRASLARLTFADECIGVDSANTALFVTDPRTGREIPMPVKELRCTTSGNESVEIQGLSVVTPLPNIRRMDHPRAVVGVKRLAGRTVEYLVGTERHTAQIRGVKEPIRDPGWTSKGFPEFPGSGTPGSATLVFGYPRGEVEIEDARTNLGVELIRRGLAFADSSCADDPVYQRAEADAKGAVIGVWQENQNAEAGGGDAPGACPTRCCPGGRRCDELTDCAAKEKCLLCMLAGAPPRWRLKLARVDFPHADKWSDVKACLTTKGNECGQICVKTEDVGTNLADFKCPYAATDLRWVTAEVIGKRVGTTTEVRIAQKVLWFNTLGPGAFCSGLRINHLEPKKDSVDGIFLTAGIHEPTALAADTGPLRVIVERGETLTTDRRHAYHYRFDATEEALSQLVEVSMSAQAKGITEPLNGPVAWKGCRINGVQRWTPVGDGLARSCDATVFRDGCECRFVLTTGHCPPINTLTIKLRDGTRAQAMFDACRALGEAGGELRAPGYKLDLQRGADSNWRLGFLGTGRTMSCGLDCGPPPAGDAKGRVSW